MWYLMVIVYIKIGVKLRFSFFFVGDRNKEVSQRVQSGTSHMRNEVTVKSFFQSCKSLEFGPKRFSLRLHCSSLEVLHVAPGEEATETGLLRRGINKIPQ